MSKFKIAHLREQGVDLIIVPLESAFGQKSTREQSEIIASLQVGAASAGLAGKVIPVWRTGHSHRFIAPPNWHAFFRKLGWNQILANINKELTIA